MNCNSFGEKLTAIARCELLDAEAKQEALNHAESCAHCNEHLRSEEILGARLKEFANESLQSEASPKIEFALREAFASHAAKQKQTVLMMPVRKTQRGAWVIGGAIAASVMVAIGLFTQSFSFSQKSMSAVVLTSGEFVELKDVVDESDWREFIVVKNFDAPKHPLSNLATARTPQQAKRKFVKSENRETEIATEFISLTQDDAVAQLETKQIVRVKLARSELLALGLPIDMGRADEKITADVMLSEEGIAKAIRLVKTSDDD